MKYLPAAAVLAGMAAAAKDSTTFAVLRFNGDGFLTEGRMDPITDPGTEAGHYHSIMGGSNFNLTVNNNDLMNADCTTAKIANDFSNYWVSTLFFQDSQGSFQKVPLFYMNVYYFFEASDDDIVAFPPGLKILTGNKDLRTPPSSSAFNLDPSQGDIQNIQFTCPQADGKSSPIYPPNSDGSTAGIIDPINTEAGVGFPTEKCDGYASPLRQDIHFPSCYNPEAGLDDYENNMVFPEMAGASGKLNCPEGYIHVPHMFYEVYWDTPQLSDQWEVDGATQPFVFSTGDVTGFGSHADFISGWDENTLQTIIDSCDAGTAGMDTCPDIPGGLSTDMDCKLEPMVTEPNSFLANTVSNALSKLPGNNPPSGWGRGPVPDEPESPEPSSTEAPSTTATPIVPIPEIPTSSEESTTTTPTPTPAPTPDGGVFIEEESDIETVWDIVTVTDTTTMFVQPTAAAKRHEHAHAHVGRHQHH